MPKDKKSAKTKSLSPSAVKDLYVPLDPDSPDATSIATANARTLIAHTDGHALVAAMERIMGLEHSDKKVWLLNMKALSAEAALAGKDVFSEKDLDLLQKLVLRVIARCEK